jgi:hypothetical protein
MESVLGAKTNSLRFEFELRFCIISQFSSTSEVSLRSHWELRVKILHSLHTCILA